MRIKGISNQAAAIIILCILGPAFFFAVAFLSIKLHQPNYDDLLDFSDTDPCPHNYAGYGFVVDEVLAASSSAAGIEILNNLSDQGCLDALKEINLIMNSRLELK